MYVVDKKFTEKAPRRSWDACWLPASSGSAAVAAVLAAELTVCEAAMTLKVAVLGWFRAELRSGDKTAALDGADPAPPVDCRSLHSLWVGCSALLDRLFKRHTAFPVSTWLASMARTGRRVWFSRRFFRDSYMPALRLPVTGRRLWRWSFGCTHHSLCLSQCWSCSQHITRGLFWA